MVNPMRPEPASQKPQSSGKLTLDFGTGKLYYQSMKFILLTAMS
jgi:hypothetical protein